MKESTEEKKYTRRQLIGAILLSVVLTLTGGVMLLYALLGQEGMAVAEGFFLIRTLFVEDADMKQVADDALSSMVETMGDRWSYYLDEDWNRSNQMHTSNQMKGIGLRVIFREEGLLVTDVVPDSGAAQAGIQLGDYLIAVEGLPLFGEERQVNKDRIAGEGGTQVALTVRNAEGEEREVSALRGIWFDPPARGEMLDNKIGYVRLFNFYDGAGDTLRKEVDFLLEQGAAGLVFDVRQNPGGYITELTQILDYLLPKGTVFQQTTSWGWTFVKKSDAANVPLPMAVLVDEDSYSAAELFAAQLRESADAYIVGEHTSGKGYFQYPFTLSNRGSLSLSIGTYTTGGGTWLAGVGLEPDLALSLDEEQELYLSARWLSKETDPQLLAALEWQRDQVK